MHESNEILLIHGEECCERIQTYIELFRNGGVIFLYRQRFSFESLRSSRMDIQLLLYGATGATRWYVDFYQGN